MSVSLSLSATFLFFLLLAFEAVLPAERVGGKQMYTLNPEASLTSFLVANNTRHSMQKTSMAGEKNDSYQIDFLLSLCYTK